MRNPKWVNLGKAFTRLGDYPGVEQDKKVFHYIENEESE